MIFTVLIPFLETILGSGLVFFVRNQLSLFTHRMLFGFAAGGNGSGKCVEFNYPLY